MNNYTHLKDHFYNHTPLNLLRTSDAKGFDDAVAELMPQLKLKGTPLEKTCLRLLLVNLGRIAHSMSDTVISYTRNHAEWAKLGRPEARAFNPLEISRKLIPVVDALEEDGWIGQRIGYYHRGPSQAGKSFNMESRLWLLQPMTDLLNKHSLVGADTHYAGRTFPVIRLKDNDKNPVYKPNTNKHIRESEAFIKRYNAFLAGQEIDLEVAKPSCFLDEKQVYRTFNRNSFTMGGRFAGGWWMRCKREERPFIFINGEETVELDYKGQHINFLYAQRGIPLPKTDVYTIPNLNREYVKQVCLTLINSDSPKEAWRSCFNKAREPNASPTLKAELNKSLSTFDSFQDFLLEPILNRHHPIKDDFCTGKGISLQYLDSEIAQHVLMAMTDQGIPCLSVHDSFIVPESHKAFLRLAMEEAYTAQGLAGLIPDIQ